MQNNFKKKGYRSSLMEMRVIAHFLYDLLSKGDNIYTSWAVGVAVTILFFWLPG